MSSSSARTSRGGRDQFQVSDIAASKDRESFLGHSILAPVGRWQVGKDLTWYAKGKAAGAGVSEDAELKAEKERIRQQEEDRRLEALGLPRSTRTQPNIVAPAVKPEAQQPQQNESTSKHSSSSLDDLPASVENLTESESARIIAEADALLAKQQRRAERKQQKKERKESKKESKSKKKKERSRSRDSSSSRSRSRSPRRHAPHSATSDSHVIPSSSSHHRSSHRKRSSSRSRSRSRERSRERSRDREDRKRSDRK